MFLLSVIVGFCIGITFFGEVGRLFGVDDNPLPRTLFRMAMLGLILTLAIYTGWGQEWTPEESLRYHLTTAFFVVVGLMVREPASEFEYEMGLSRLLNPILTRFEPPQYRGPEFLVNMEVDSFVQLVVYFFGHRQGLNYHALLAGEPLLKNVDPVHIQNIVQRQAFGQQSASQILGRLAVSKPKSFTRILDHLLKFSVGAGLADQSFVQRLFILAGGEGLSSKHYEALLRKYGLSAVWNNRSGHTFQEDAWTRREQSGGSFGHQHGGQSLSDRDRYLAVLGLQPGACAKEIKKAFRKMAKIYHPDRNRGKSEAEQERAAEKMRALNLAFDWLKTNS